MRGESMKDKSKKSTYSTTFGVDPIFRPIIGSFNIVFPKINAIAKPVVCISARVQIAVQDNIIHSRYIATVVTDKNKGRIHLFAFLRFFALIEVWIDSP